MQSGPTTHAASPAGGPAPQPASSSGVLRLRDPRQRVHRKSILLWTLRTTIFWLVIILGQTAGEIFASPPPSWLAVTLIISIVLGVVQVVVEPQWRYRVHRWEANQEAVVTRSGWVTQEWRVAPLSRIQTVDTKRGPLEQMLGLATVTVTTASAAGPVQIAGLGHDDAARLVDELTAVTQATPGDAT
ncbi:MAG TPA: PH domain-containing protein [Pseudonocardiaceae bacterium]|nr:PH domain-containing protein [Pseudonocardiaceae bacterium]